MKRLLIILSVIISSAYSESFSQPAWTRVTDSIPNLVIMSMQFTSANRGYACGSYNTISPGAFLRTTNGGLNWQVTQFPNVSVDALSFVDQNTGYLSCWAVPKSYVYKTTNGGDNWFIADSLGTSFFDIKFFNANTGCVVAKYNMNHFTTDGGYTWTTNSNGFWAEPQTLLCLNADTWLVAMGETHISKTTNRGGNWNIINFNSGNYVYSLSFINASTGFALAYNGKVFKSTSAGDNWTQISSLGDSSLYNGCIMFPNSATGYISYSQGIFKSTNGGYNWNTLPFSNTAGLYLVYFLNRDTGFTGGNHGFIYRTTTGGTVGINAISEEIPEKYSLSQNYPNPFNPVTKISFNIPLWRGAGGWNTAILKVYDISGREVQTLVNESLQPGTYEVSFNGAGLTSGVYFYKITASNYSETKKMLLVK
jgi:photosystem II stability/assembly factor-like uncharacterized protein